MYTASYQENSKKGNYLYIEKPYSGITGILNEDNKKKYN